MFGKLVRFTAQPGRGDALTEALLAGADMLREDDGCLQFLISREPEDPNVIWLTEVWVSEAAHDETMQGEAAKRERETSSALIARVEETQLLVLGGKGI